MPIGTLEEHLTQFAFTKEEERAVGVYCTMIALLHGGTRTEKGRAMLNAGFADGRGTVLYVAEQLRAVETHYRN